MPIDLRAALAREPAAEPASPHADTSEAPEPSHLPLPDGLQRAVFAHIDQADDVARVGQVCSSWRSWSQKCGALRAAQVKQRFESGDVVALSRILANPASLASVREAGQFCPVTAAWEAHNRGQDGLLRCVVHFYGARPVLEGFLTNPPQGASLSASFLAKLSRGLNLTEVDTEHGSLAHRVCNGSAKAEMRLAALTWLVDCGIDFTAVDRHRNTVAHILAGLQSDVVPDLALLARRSKLKPCLETINRQGHTPLHVAAMRSGSGVGRTLHFLCHLGACLTAPPGFPTFDRSLCAHHPTHGARILARLREPWVEA